MAGWVVGREAELVKLDELLVGAREGLRVLVLEGEPGIGKTTVWREGIERAAARGFRVLSCRAAQTESRLSFGGLSDLLAPVEAQAFAELPAPQRRALEIALLRVAAEGIALDPRAIATGLMSLISGLAAHGPLLLALDDEQWLDRPSARALQFALRRVETRPVAVLATMRIDQRARVADVASAVAPERLERLRLGPLSLGALHELLRARLGQTLTRPLLGTIERACGGRPFYALEIARALEAQPASVPGRALPVPTDMAEVVARRLRQLPRRTRDELLKASALARPSLSLLNHEALAPAVEARLVSVRHDDDVLEFAHPLFAGALYAAASREQRRRLHHDLAGQVADVEEQARHLALASDGPDEAVALALDRGADLAYRRGAPEVAAELAELAAQRTPQEAVDLRDQRYLRAVRHHVKAGERERAGALAEQVIAGCTTTHVRTSALYLLGEVRGPESPTAAIPLLEQALACAVDDVSLQAQLETSLGYLAVVIADAGGALRHLGRAVELAELAGESALLAEAIALRAQAALMFGRGLDEQALERALELEERERDVLFQLRPSLNVALVYEFTGRIGAARELLVGLRERIVARGEESDLAYVLVHLAGTSLLAGDLELAEREATDALRVAELNGQDIFCAFSLAMRALARALRGDGVGSRSDVSQALEISERIGWPHGVILARWAQGVLALSEGDAAAATAALEPVVALIEQIGVYEWPIAMALPDAIDAFVATGELERAAKLTASLAAWGRTHDRPWALALSARCQALLHAAAGDLPAAERAARRAVVEHERLPMPFELARTQLVLGQIQRRCGQRRAARESLQRAHALFEQIGAPVWARKAHSEMARIGVRRAPGELTDSEQRVAALAASGLTNREIAAQLFISRRTVEANLARAYRKLSIRSRAELGTTMAARQDHTPS